MSGGLLGAGVTMIHIDEDTKEWFTLLRAWKVRRAWGQEKNPRKIFLQLQGWQHEPTKAQRGGTKAESCHDRKVGESSNEQ